MFGYIRPYKFELSDKDYELYKAVYCGLCKQLGKDYGFLTRAILSYDGTFFALIAGGLDCSSGNPVLTKESCTCNPFKKCVYCSVENNSLEIAAAFSVISFYYKLSDDKYDEKFFKSWMAGVLKSFSKNKKIKASVNYPKYEKILSNMLDMQFQTERLDACSIDCAADPTAKMLSAVMAELAYNQMEKKIYADFGYFLGRWVYLIDAVDDFERDRKNSSFNPIVAKFANMPDMNFNNDDFKNYCNGLLNQTVARLAANYKLMNIKNFKTITDNIIYKGIPDMQRRVIFDRKNK